MEGIGVAANIIAVTDLSLKVVTLCLRYSREVSGARDDIERLSSQVQHLAGALRATQRVVEDSPVALVSQELMVSFRSCITDLQVVEGKLNPSLIRTGMRRFGLRALKWPFKKKEIDQLLAGLERHEKAIMLGLQVDQTAILIDIQERVKDMSLKPIDEPSSYQQRHLAVPFTNDPDFVPRPTIETWMHQRYTQPSQRMALVGMGGFGKSKLAIQFAHRIYADEDDTSVFWVHAGSKTAFEESYRALADLVSLPRRPEPDTNVLLLVRNWLQRQDIPSWLLIIDNADDIDLFYPPNLNNGIASYIPKSNKGKVLITSRSLDVAERLVGSSKAIMRVPVMAEEQALHLLQSTLESAADEESARAIVRALDFIPLAVKQAAGYVNRRSPQVTPKSYLDEFHESERKRDSLLRSDKGDLDRNDGVSSSVIVTWQITFDKIKEEHPSAANLLSLMSQFQAQNIPDFMLHDYDDNHTTERSNHHNKDKTSDGPSFEDDLDVLRGYSLVHVTTRGLFEMHSLVQFCTRQWIIKCGTPDRWNELYIQLASHHYPCGCFETWGTCRSLLPHIEPILDKKPRRSHVLADWHRLQNNVSWYKSQIDEYRHSLALLVDTIMISTDKLGQMHACILLNKGMLSLALLTHGRLEEAERTYVEVISSTVVEYGNASKLSSILGRQDASKEDVKMQVEAWKKQRVTPSPDHPRTFRSPSELAAVFTLLSRLE
ncbi:kinesin light chain 3 [Fusarium longipes]|uniref:Kinesin light chain 3 n=1 Tax=Fusarium longipes TaxID=694270 RepID=A0A395SZV7_9HYPO|nr:kinesin light chain 3 [Fusarium longipes]